MPLYSVDLNYTLYVKADNAAEAGSIAKWSHRDQEPDIVAQRIKPGDWVDPDSLEFPPYSERGDTDETTLGELLKAQREREKDFPSAQSLETVGQLTLKEETE